MADVNCAYMTRGIATGTPYVTVTISNGFPEVATMNWRICC